MRLIKQNIERDGSGTVTLFPEDPEDMAGPLTTSPEFYANALLPSGSRTILFVLVISCEPQLSAV